MAVKKLQARIVKAQKEGKHGKVKSLQWVLTHSFYAKALAVKRVTSNNGKKTSGIDHVIWETPRAKYQAITTLKRNGYKPQPLKRVCIKNEKREITSPWYSNYERQSYAGTVSNGIGTSG